MATIGSGLTSLQNTSRRSYLSVAPFNNDLYVYSTYINANRETKGTFVVNPDATSLNCPKGNVLHENGRKLIPGAYPGVTTYMVGVYDPQSLLSGFIDPNSPLFASYNTDKPNFITPTWGVDPGTGGGSTNDLGAPVYTNGTVEAVGNITSTTGNIAATTGSVSAGTTVTAGTSVRAGTFTGAGVVTPALYNVGLTGVPYNGTATSCDVFCNPQLGNVFLITVPSAVSVSVNVYIRNPATPGTSLTSTNPGQPIYIHIKNQSGNTPNIPIIDDTIVRCSDISSMANNSRAVVSLICDGTFALQSCAIVTGLAI